MRMIQRVGYFLGEVHRRHPTTAYLPFDRVAVGESSLETAQDIFGHVMLTPRSRA